MSIKWFKNVKKQTILEEEPIVKCSVYYISCDSIRPNTMRSRCDFNEDKLITLAYSIKRYGVIEPICVRETDSDDSYLYELIAGERRLRAAKLAGLKTIPCIIIDVEQSISAELSIIENLNFEPLNYFETAVALQRLVELDNVSFDDLASRLSITQKEMTKKLLLLELSYEERQALLNADITEPVALEIARISDKATRRAVIDGVCSKDMSENAMLSFIDSFKHKNANADAKELPRDVSSVIKAISSKIGFLNRRRKRAELKTDYSADTITVELQIKL